MEKRSTYRWNPEDYSLHSKEQERWARELMAKLGLKGDERVLDLGCGDGKVTAEIARFLSDGSVLGIDSSPEMIEFAKSSFMDASKNLAFLCVDVREMGFTREFDLVFSNAALHWVKDHGPVLVRIKKALRPGGRVVLQMAGEGNAATVVQTVSEVIGREPWSPFFEGFTFPYGFYGPDQYRAMVEEAGLVVKRLELIPKQMAHKGREGLSGWVRTTWLPYIERVPMEQRDRFIEDIVSAYGSSYPPREGVFCLDMMRLELEAFREARKAG